MAKDNLAQYTFVGCLFLGVGIGLLVDQVAGSTLVGMGMGFLAMYYVKNLEKKK